MFCIKCGAKNDDDALFCVSCGCRMTLATVNDNANVVDLTKVDKKINEEQKPTQEQQPVFEQQPVQEQQPAYEQQQVFKQQPVYEQQPAYEQQPVFEQQPVYEQQPAYEQQPVFEQQPAYNPGFESATGKKKGRIPRIVFSLLMCTAGIVTIIMLFVGSFLSIDLKTSYKDGSESDKMTYTCLELNDITEDVDEIEGEDDEEFTRIYEDVISTSDTIKYVAYAIIGCVILFALVNLIVSIIGIRKAKRGVYAFSLVGGIANIGLLSGLWYLWSEKFLSVITRWYEYKFAEYFEMLGGTMTLTFLPEMMFYVALVCQAVVLISSIVLLLMKGNTVNK